MSRKDWEKEQLHFLCPLNDFWHRRHGIGPNVTIQGHTLLQENSHPMPQLLVWILRTTIILASWLQIWEFPLLLQIWFARLTHQNLRECYTDGYTLLWLQEIRTIQMENVTENDLREAQIWKLSLAVNVWTLWTCRPHYPNMWWHSQYQQSLKLNFFSGLSFCSGSIT